MCSELSDSSCHNQELYLSMFNIPFKLDNNPGRSCMSQTSQQSYQELNHCICILNNHLTAQSEGTNFYIQYMSSHLNKFYNQLLLIDKICRFCLICSFRLYISNILQLYTNLQHNQLYLNTFYTFPYLNSSRLNSLSSPFVCRKCSQPNCYCKDCIYLRTNSFQCHIRDSSWNQRNSSMLFHGIPGSHSIQLSLEKRNQVHMIAS